jgi:hypothetical protein
MRTELVLHAFKADEGDGARSKPCASPIDAVRRARGRGAGPRRAGDA